MSDAANHTISEVMSAAVRDIAANDAATSDSVQDLLRRSSQRFQRTLEAVNDAV